MISISPNDKPKLGINNDAKKAAYISNIIKEHLIPKYSSNEEWSRFFEYLSSHEAFTTSNHYYRYLNTFGMIAMQFGEIIDKIIIETGAACPITSYLANRNQCFATTSDLRIEFDVDSDFADIVISLEVIEHIKDIPEKNFSEIVLFQETGIKSFASEVYRIMKPGGGMFLTTPNVCAYKAIANAIEHKAPCLFRPHIREYTKDELLSLFYQLNLRHHSTMFNFFMLGDSTKSWDEMFSSIGWSVKDRGDDHFLYFTKPTSQMS